MGELFRAAKDYLEQGFSVIPVAIMRMTGRKVALVKWEEFQHRKPTLEEVESWFSDPYQFKLIQTGNDIGIAIVTGCVSGNLAVIDFDNPEAHAELSKVLEAAPEIYEKLVNTWIVETGKGYHYYIRVRDPDPEKFTNRLKLGGKDIDVRAEGGYVVAPPSPHPSGKTYRFVNKPEKIAELSWEEYITLLRLLEGGKEESKLGSGKVRRLSESEILEIVNLVKPIYRPGNRHYIVYYLTAWLRKAGVPFEAARKIVELLAEDDEERSNRLYQAEWNYGLKGKDKPEEELKGKSGLQEIAEALLGEEKALELIRRLEKVIGQASPFRDSVFSIIDFAPKERYFVANLKKGIIVRAFRDKNGNLVYERFIAECCPVRVVVYEDPLGGLTKYEIEFDGLLKKTIGPTELETIIDRVIAEGVVKDRNLIRNALPSLVTAFRNKGRAEIRRELEKPGFYYIDGEIKAVKWEAEEFTKEDLRRALELLKELRERWYPHLAERFTTIIKWGLIAPFSYAIKQIRGIYGIHFPWLFLHGSASTGKTTLGRMIRATWNLPFEEKGGSHIDTVPRFGKVVSESTFPILINEVADVIQKDSIKEIIKSSIESKSARGRYVQKNYVEEPALAAMIFTTNKVFPLDDALLRRFLPILFTVSDRVKADRAEEFETKVLPRIYDLRFLGYFVFRKISENPELLKGDWKELATQLLREAFEFAGLEVPEWIEETHSGVSLEEVDEILNEEIRAKFLEDVNSRFSRYISKVEVWSENGDDVHVTRDLRSRVLALLSDNFLPWAVLKGDKVVITSSVLKVLDGLPIDSLKSLAERLGWEYGSTRLGSKFVKAAKVDVETFIEFLSGNLGEGDSDESESPDLPPDDSNPENQPSSDEEDLYELVRTKSPLEEIIDFIKPVDSSDAKGDPPPEVATFRFSSDVKPQEIRLSSGETLKIAPGLTIRMERKLAETLEFYGYGEVVDR